MQITFLKTCAKFKDIIEGKFGPGKCASFDTVGSVESSRCRTFETFIRAPVKVSGLLAIMLNPCIFADYLD